jgi:hypothetical protein
MTIQLRTEIKRRIIYRKITDSLLATLQAGLLLTLLIITWSLAVAL